MAINHNDCPVPTIESATGVPAVTSKADTDISTAQQYQRTKYENALTVSMDGIRMNESQQPLDPAVLAEQVKFNKWRARKTS